MQTKREYAISLGLATEGRGRLSREAHAAIDKAISEGKQFAETGPVAVTKQSPKPKRQETETADEISVDVFSRFPLDTRFKGTDKDGKTFFLSAREVCRTCGYSFTSHSCDDARGLSPSNVFVSVEPC